ncbi:MAG: hypothetical protein Tsb0020_02030 [Haliangiales bacterium]
MTRRGHRAETTESGEQAADEPYPPASETVLDRALAALAADLDAIEGTSQAPPDSAGDRAPTAPAGERRDPDELGESIRERYSELLDEYSDDPEAIGRIRRIGRRIDSLTEAGLLPRTFMRRGARRR